ncbi:unnamed protein product, partial [Cyprideis torosa]
AELFVFGQRCLSSRNCHTYAANTVCENFRCVCRPDYEWDGTTGKCYDPDPIRARKRIKEFFGLERGLSAQQTQSEDLIFLNLGFLAPKYCVNSFYGFEYMGTIATTISGKTCL